MADPTTGSSAIATDQPTTKAPWLSKTLWVNAVIALAAVFAPGASTWIAQNPTVVALVISAVNILLRLLTKDKLSIGD